MSGRALIPGPKARTCDSQALRAGRHPLESPSAQRASFFRDVIKIRFMQLFASSRTFSVRNCQESNRDVNGASKLAAYEARLAIAFRPLRAIDRAGVRTASEAMAYEGHADRRFNGPIVASPLTGAQRLVGLQEQPSGFGDRRRGHTAQCSGRSRKACKVSLILTSCALALFSTSRARQTPSGRAAT